MAKFMRRDGEHGEGTGRNWRERRRTRRRRSMHRRRSAFAASPASPPDRTAATSRGRLVMTQQILGPKGRRRKRWTFLMCLVVAIATGLLVITGAQAVHDDGVFQLDRNAYTASDGGSTPAAHDWDQVCPAATPA